VPLRRHYSVDFFDYESFRFTMSMQNVVLVFRQILTVWNYDYIMDIEFHQSGVIKTSVSVCYIHQCKCVLHTSV